MDRATQAVGMYFEKKYPQRNTASTNTTFRKDEGARFGVLAAFLRENSPESICDIGCGDGVMLAALLQKKTEKPKRIHLVDIATRFLGLAKENLEPYGLQVTSENSSLFDCAHQLFDLVIAMGVSDYCKDWDGLLAILISRTQNTLIVDFPKASPPRHILRKIWLLLHGISLHTISLKSLQILLKKHQIQYRIYNTKYNHVVRIQRNF